MSKKVWIAIVVIAVISLGTGFYIYLGTRSQSPSPTSSISGPLKVEEGVSPETREPDDGPDIEIVAENLEIPWEVAFLPNGELLVTERPGRLIKIGKERKVYEISGVRDVGEGGLLGLALHPDFKNNQLIYLYLTSSDAGKIVNRVERYRLENDSLINREVILEGIAGASNHDGGRIEFGPDGFLYITTGDAQKPNLAQDINSLNGKILRVKDDGSIPPDNPFGNAVYSYGHRNVQGITWDSEGRLWATEHGRSGLLSGLDELNLIEPGKNYGWPDIQGDETREGMVAPIIHSGASETWAPAGAEFIKDSIFFTGLRGSTLYQAKIENENVTTLVKHFENQYGRLRAVRLGPDGYLYITTSNQDGRGPPRQGDDKIIRINPRIFR
ncbi:PQQ-dependent sugar dehydrogenase [Patescibacteria group bacterium]|nr:PQQ-dependent sugar dehydrogenase [Patescibacteria group bacterium]